MTVKLNSVKLLICFLLLSGSAIAQEDELSAPLIFGVNESPPFHITKGDQVNSGFCDVLVETIKAELPGTDQVIRKMPHGRIRTIMKREGSMCFPCMINRTSYNPNYYFSKTTHLYAPHGIITRASLAKDITERYGNPVSLEKLLAESELRFAQPVGRRYGDIQHLIDEHLVGTKHHKQVYGELALYNLLAMILINRVDFTIDYEMMIQSYQRNAGAQKSKEALSFIPIEEYEGKVIRGAVGCSNNEWGKNATQLIDKAINDIRRNKDFQQSLDYWLGTDRPKLNELTTK
ncbi:MULTISPECIES: hypothetical protein [Idiomarina]|jgi:uncharacterized protein (TIGR02285 family)|uniref:ABC transporter substrate-binding protein n=1 Tax=Idiomarina abyssalis TaxID=86102 RepID=A0A8I1GCF7_9GAMM|nr:MULTISPECIES: hypothetical protein [Idiomarina]MAO68140.1 hypothetical protein [Idiomarina sp.]MBF79892.1 hypothetical protein [Idiomarina sp.]MBJ7265844.1 hypothetical protein [Idiomarina abyssalis]MBJ7274783.1 hypothetical protein [Idiomarina abyssalis]MBJ7315851.1 hypothetical protein [Idiomarina abyssalis]|tara:strand:- start:26002 stop:26871 length:870 start_codon:yes stop_codon:yes gene_type:complete